MPETVQISYVSILESAERDVGPLCRSLGPALGGFVRHFKAGKLKVMKIMLLEMAHI